VAIEHHIKTVCPVADLTVLLKLALISKKTRDGAAKPAAPLPVATSSAKTGRYKIEKGPSGCRAMIGGPSTAMPSPAVVNRVQSGNGRHEYCRFYRALRKYQDTLPGYLIAALVFVFALGVREAVDPYIKIPYVTLFPAMIICSLVGAVPPAFWRRSWVA